MVKESINNPFNASKENSVSQWKFPHGREISPLVLQDFGQFIIHHELHRKGDIACTQPSLDDPLEVHFFSDDPKGNDDVFFLRQDYENHCLKIISANGDLKKINKMMEEFGMVQD